jgi:dihydrodiol dehydrogenase / D-xylose 1-dehydrogenase (NADP)
MVDRIRWGIMGTGWIAKQFATGLQFLPDADLLAVGSRTAEAASRFAEGFGVPRRYASYEALVHDPDLDVIYVATPHPMHKENALLCLNAGKPVLCEKPFALNAVEAGEVMALARERKLFLMEAMWSRFLPLMSRVRQMLEERVIGTVDMLVADLCLRFDFDPSDRRYAPELGGGALLDLGVYPLSLASMVFGQPSRITSMAALGSTGVDEQATIVLGYAQGQLASLYTSLRVDSAVEALLLGRGGRMRIHSMWIKPSMLSVTLTTGQERTFEIPFDGNGYNYEAAEVMRCLKEGRFESEVMPLDETLNIMRTMDEIRAHWGLRYPTE